MKIGIGITTTPNRPDHLDLCLEQINKYSHFEYQMFVSIDNESKGVAWNKNQCIRELKDCDYVFLFDDDCFPIANDWHKCFIEASSDSGQNHLIYQIETTDARIVKTEGLVNLFNNANGCLLFMTKSVIDTVGLMNESFGRYGFEHADYSLRVSKSGLNTQPFYSPVNASDYIYSLDLQNTIDFDIDHKPSLPPDIMNSSVILASKHLNKDAEINIPL